MDLQNSREVALTGQRCHELATFFYGFGGLQSFRPFGAIPGPLQGRDRARLSEACPAEIFFTELFLPDEFKACLYRYGQP
jgi:hypothetical protein